MRLHKVIAIPAIAFTFTNFECVISIGKQLRIIMTGVKCLVGHCFAHLSTEARRI